MCLMDIRLRQESSTARRESFQQAANFLTAELVKRATHAHSKVADGKRAMADGRRTVLFLDGTSIRYSLSRFLSTL